MIVLTKIDRVDDAGLYRARAEALQRDLPGVPLNAKARDAADRLSPWCGPGRTVVLFGSSGVGKSTLLNTLADKAPAVAQLPGTIRDGDDKGRHTTTARSLHTIARGACVIDTPGMRTLHVSDADAGLDMLYAEIADLAPEVSNQGLHPGARTGLRSWGRRHDRRPVGCACGSLAQARHGEPCQHPCPFRPARQQDLRPAQKAVSTQNARSCAIARGRKCVSVVMRPRGPLTPACEMPPHRYHHLPVSNRHLLAMGPDPNSNPVLNRQA